MQLATSVVLITGASRGLGFEIATAFAARGARLVLTARGEAELDQAVDRVRRVPGPHGRLPEVLAIQADVSDAQQARQLVRRGLDRFGHIDVLINNASALGGSPMPRLDAVNPLVFEETLRVNVVAPLHLTQLVLPLMKARGRGVIINVTSDAAVEAYAGWGAYGASKAALEHLSRILAAELDGAGIRIYVVDPGEMNTRMHQDAEPGADLSHLPPPAVAAPAFVRLVEDEPAPFGRFQAQRMAVQPEPVS
jgi:NAD(P)-dependent dehydrogenase (short-subunit alcohol dehydrogenase family)